MDKFWHSMRCTCTPNLYGKLHSLACGISPGGVAGVLQRGAPEPSRFCFVSRLTKVMPKIEMVDKLTNQVHFN
jgi:hypothetical protein